ncbi:hypothetical protein HDV04_004765 [Boothiomyces sp. JEL0838]|nr:hypothetical protein HDV04_004765 [Boothiomyces sp. JEL0838]
MKFTAIFASLLAFVSASKNGSPLCYYDDQTMQQGMGDPAPLGYSVKVSKSGGSYTVQLLNKDTTAVYQGLLMFVTTPGGTDSHLGSFTSYDTSKFKNVNPSFCSNDGVSGLASATITHKNPYDYAVGHGNNFTWTPNSGDFSNGNLSLTVIVSAFTPDQPSGRPPWQHIPEVVVPK